MVVYVVISQAYGPHARPNGYVILKKIECDAIPKNVKNLKSNHLELHTDIYMETYYDNLESAMRHYRADCDAYRRNPGIIKYPPDM